MKVDQIQNSPPPQATVHPQRRDLCLLSSREQEVLTLAAQGCSDVVISQRLGLSPNTIHTYWVRMRTKFGIASRPALVEAFTSVLRCTDGLGGSDVRFDLDDFACEWTAELQSRLGLDECSLNFDDLASHCHPEDAAHLQRLLASAREGKLRSFHVTLRPIEAQSQLHLFLHVVEEDGAPRWAYGSQIDRRPGRPPSKLVPQNR